MSAITQGDRVFHPNKKEWGLGKVLNVTPENVDVFFVGAGAKRLSRSFVGLESVEGITAKHPLLDNLTDPSQIDDARFITLPAAIERFLTTYPDGLEDARYQKDERQANFRGHQFCVQLLGEDELTGLIAEEKFQDVCDRARHVESFTNLLTKAEKTAFYGALDNPVNQRTFSLALADLLYGSDSEENRFKQFVRALDLFGVSIWPLATLFGFIRFPAERAFIKPTVIQNAAKALCWRITYKPEPNWRTYSAVLRLYKHVRNSLIEEGNIPRDNIDVQSVIWSIGQK
jgi:hypothetical protein